jgi:hypothetical protein
MSALPPKVDIAEFEEHVRLVQKADILHCGKKYTRLFDQPSA